jgi:DNA repair protein RadD
VITLRYYQQDAIQSIYDYYSRPFDMPTIGHNGGPPIAPERNPIVAMPTGTGKSLVIGGFAYDVLNRWPGQRIIMATHVKELIVQNAAKINEMWPGAPLGIYSAGLKQKDATQPLIYGGVASMVNNPLLFGWRDLMLVDEGHLIGHNAEAQYQLLIRGLRSINPKMKIVCFTATPYRMGMGYLTNGNIFTDFCYDITGLEAFNKLIAEGWLSMLIPIPDIVGMSHDGLHTSSNGDYVQKEIEERAMRITREALDSAIRFKSSRHSWLVFASGIDHVYQIRDMLIARGVSATVVHTGTKDHPLTDKERDDNIADFKLGKYQAIINYGVLTTGFDHPPIDLIIMLRMTKSVPLWVQMLGRGTRPFDGSFMFPPKKNCIVLDFARNTMRLGPINDPVIPVRKGQGKGDAPVKVCKHCGTYNHISVRFCCGCGAEFDFETKVISLASSAALIRNNEDAPAPIYKRYPVRSVFYSRYTGKNSGLDTLRATYQVEGLSLPIHEYVSIEGEGRAAVHAADWWMQRSAVDVPTTITGALQLLGSLRKPANLVIWENPPNGFPKIERSEYV